MSRRAPVRMLEENASLIPSRLAAASMHFQAGRLPEAEQACREILAMDPDHAAALHLLGLVAFQAGRVDLAAEWIGRACTLNPHYAEAFGNLGQVLQSTGDLERAEASFARAVELNPGFAEALTNLGNLLSAQGRWEEAIDCHQRAVAARPGYADGWCNLGIALSEAGRRDEAIASLVQAITLKPDLAEGHNNLGLVLQEMGRGEEALAHFDRALTLNPNYAEAHNNRGYAFETRGRTDEALEEYASALRLKPRYAEAVNNLGGLFESGGRLADAAECFELSVAWKPDFAIAHYNRSLIHLITGDLETGFQGYKWRRGFLPQRKFPCPQWRGEPLQGARILLYAEQGLGDAIHFLRYVSDVLALAQEVVLEVGKPLLRLAQEIPGVSRVLCLGEELPPCQWECSLMSLPGVLGTRRETIPANVPYLTVPEAVQRKAQGIVSAGTRLRIGLVWAGAPAHKKDRWRSLPLHLFQDLLTATNASFYSFQLGSAALERAALPDASSSRITDLTSHIDDMADTAALLQRMDLVISVDTAVAHLAGALGVPVWVMLPFAPDWRWLLNRSDSPWYPTMRLFRQPGPGDWPSVIRSVQAALRTELASLVKAGLSELPLKDGG